MTDAVKDRPHYVYRAFAPDETLLYVGCTFDVLARLKGHSSASAWWGYHARIDTEGPYDFDVARGKEWEAICHEHPTYNANEPRRSSHDGQWERITRFAGNLAGMDNWMFGDAYDIGAATADRFLRRVRTGQAFDWHQSIYVSESWNNFLTAPIEYTWAGMRILIGDGWRPTWSTSPRWRILPYHWDVWSMGDLPSGIRYGDQNLPEHQEIDDVVRMRSRFPFPKLEVKEAWINERMTPTP